MLHVHGNVKDSEEALWTEHVLRSMDELARSEGIILTCGVIKVQLAF